jgi:hypothetical protein
VILYKKRQVILSEIETLDKSVPAGNIKKKLKLLRENMITRREYRFQLFLPLLKLLNAYTLSLTNDNLNDTISVYTEIFEIFDEKCPFDLTYVYVILFQYYHTMGNKNEALKNLKLAIESFKTFRGITQNVLEVLKLIYENELKQTALEQYLE